MVDQEGIELAGIEEAAMEAERRGQKIAAGEAMKPVPHNRGVIIVDEEWRTILELPIDFAG